MLELKNISFKRDGKQILDNISIKIEKDKLIAITGPNGSGKSTLAKIIMGILLPDSGSILFNGIDITNLSINDRANLGIAFAFQQPVRFKGLTVFDLLKRANKNIKRKDACKALLDVGLCAKNYLDRELNSSLSGGELKRIEIASVILRNSSLTIFDEPEAGIDLWSFNNLIEVFKNINKGSTIIITHQERILEIVEKIILLNEGKVVMYENKEKAFKRIKAMSDCDIKGECKNEYCA